MSLWIAHHRGTPYGFPRRQRKLCRRLQHRSAARPANQLPRLLLRVASVSPREADSTTASGAVNQKQISTVGCMAEARKGATTTLAFSASCRFGNDDEKNFPARSCTVENVSRSAKFSPWLVEQMIVIVSRAATCALMRDVRCLFRPTWRVRSQRAAKTLPSHTINEACMALRDVSHCMKHTIASMSRALVPIPAEEVCCRRI